MKRTASPTHLQEAGVVASMDRPQLSRPRRDPPTGRERLFRDPEDVQPASHRQGGRAWSASRMTRAAADPTCVRQSYSLPHRFRRSARRGTWSCGERARHFVRTICRTDTQTAGYPRGGARGGEDIQDASTMCCMWDTGMVGRVACPTMVVSRWWVAEVTSWKCCAAVRPRQAVGLMAPA